jgi:gluconolactonase
MYFGEIEGTRFDMRDSRAGSLLIAHARIERLWSGARWCEGPAWFPAHGTLVWSDIPNDRLMRYDEASDGTGVFRAPSRNANGNTVDAQGRLISCEHLTRRVTRTEHDGRLTVLADRYKGQCLNSPNDVTVAADGSIWFTDPMYGIMTSYEGVRAESEIGQCHVYRIDGTTGELTVAADDFVQPNGICFSPDQRVLYISDSGGTHTPRGPRHIRACELDGDGRRIVRSRVLAESTAGFFDGFRCDEHGTIWTSAGDGVHILSVHGELLAKIVIPEIVANVCFGGAKRNRLFICATTSLYAVYTAVHGAGLP